VLVLVWCMLLLYRRFFFFQAEDGIRDWSVTGVQTCALPISRSSPTLKSWRDTADRTASRKSCISPPAPARGPRTSGPAPPAASRSEERRVGKEGRSRWSAEH